MVMIQTKLISWFSNLSRNSRFFVILLMILIIAWIDQITPAEFSVRLLYLVPIFLSIWYDKGIKLGIFFSILSTFLYYYGNIQNGIYNLHGIYVIWELVGVCGFFIVFVVSIG